MGRNCPRISAGAFGRAQELLKRSVPNLGGPAERAQAKRMEGVIRFVDGRGGDTPSLLFDAAMNEKSMLWVQTFSAGLDWPLFRQVFDRGVRMSNSNAQAIAIACPDATRSA